MRVMNRSEIDIRLTNRRMARDYYEASKALQQSIENASKYEKMARQHVGTNQT